jgi:hypothetical protein
VRLDKSERLEKVYHQQLVSGLPKKPCPSMPGVAAMLKLMAQHGLNPKATD